MKIAIVGSRGWKDREIIKKYISTLPKDTVIVSGGAKGADLIAESCAKELGLETKIFLPEWSEHGSRAGIFRNSLIVSYSDKVVAFWDGQSKGTKDTIDKALKASNIKEILIIKEIQENAW